MNRDCQPANCDITPPSRSLHAVSGEEVQMREQGGTGEDFGDGGWVGK